MWLTDLVYLYPEYTKTDTSPSCPSNFRAANYLLVVKLFARLREMESG